jgi:hypothetical protein
VTLAIIGRLEILRDNPDSAESFLKDAEVKVHAAGDNGLDEAIVDEAYGVVLAVNHKWAEARTYLREAVQVSGNMTTFAPELPECLSMLRKVDRHLHRRAEARAAGAQLKALNSVQQSKAPTAATVDVATLQQTLR